jgi:hypothetical protein
MKYFIGILIITLSLAYGYFCLCFPWLMLRTIAKWPRFVFGRLLPSVKVHASLTEALDEIFSTRSEKSPRIEAGLKIIRSTGITAILFAVVSSCIVLASALGLD